MGQTSRLGLPYPDDPDLPDVPQDMQELAEELDDNVLVGSHGLLADRPVSTPGTPGIIDRYYFADDTKQLYRDHGTGWDLVVPDGKTGEVKQVAYPVVSGNEEAGWLLCDGRAVSRATYAALYAKVSTNFGPGDGSTTFNLPDFRGRGPIGVGVGVGGGAAGESGSKPTGGAALTDRSLGEWGGKETHVLTLVEMPIHDHVLRIANQPASDFDRVTGSGDLGGAGTGSQAVENAGGSGAHTNLQPLLALNFIIKT